MTETSRHANALPLEQAAIRAMCFHPSGTFVEFPEEDVERSIPERFEKVVRRYPDRIAVKTRDCEFSYRQLNQAANRIAHAILTQRAVQVEPVAILLPNSAPALAAILGVLKAGRFYVLLDPSFPLTRLKLLMQDSGASLLISDNQNSSLTHELVSTHSSRLNCDELDLNVSAEDPGLYISPNALAFIIYTSGSTGAPKGVVHSHRNLLHNVMNVSNILKMCAEDRSTVFASFGTGQAVTDINVALLNGASLYPRNIKEEGLNSLASWLIEEGITIYRSSATAFRSFVETLSGKEWFPNLRLIKLGSEPVLAKDVESCRRHFTRGCVLVNALSITEALTVCLNLIDTEISVTGNSLPVGYALADTIVRLFDDSGNQVGVNHVGEITISSQYLSPGYWRKPDLTQKAFASDPNRSSERVYWSGDIGRLSSDGCLYHFGRKDFRVQIRGYSVELAEIEIALMGFEDIEEVIVVAKENNKGDTRLLGYLVPRKNQKPSLNGLRRALREKLPDYMVPSSFVILHSMPLTPSGKVDRRALPDPGRSRPDLDQPYVPPRTPGERQLAEIWAEVLSLDQIGIDDNFFDLGGHSLAATRVVSQVIKKFRLELPLKALFESPTVAQMATVIVEHRAKKLGEEDLHHILTGLETLSDEEAKLRST